MWTAAAREVCGLLKLGRKKVEKGMKKEKDENFGKKMGGPEVGTGHEQQEEPWDMANTCSDFCQYWVRICTFSVW